MIIYSDDTMKYESQSISISSTSLSTTRFCSKHTATVCPHDNEITSYEIETQVHFIAQTTLGSTYSS